MGELTPQLIFSVAVWAKETCPPPLTIYFRQEIWLRVMSVGKLAMSLASCNTQKNISPASHLGSRVEPAMDMGIAGELVLRA